MIKVGILRRGVYPQLSVWALNAISCILIKNKKKQLEIDIQKRRCTEKRMQCEREAEVRVV